MVYGTGYGDKHLQWTNQSRCLNLTNGNYTDGNQVHRTDVELFGWRGESDLDTGYILLSPPLNRFTLC